MAILLTRDNDALNVNPVPAGVDQSLSVNGSDWLWAVTAIYGFSFVAFLTLSYRAKAGEKIFHYLYNIALLVGTISYFAMASDLGYSIVTEVNTQGNGVTRQVFFAKYVNWVVSFPVALISLGLISGVSWATIFYNVALSWTWVISYLVAAYTTTNYKWGFFAFGTVSWILLAVCSLTDGHSGAKRVGVSRDYLLLTGWLNLLWLLYPIAFGLSDGGNYINGTSGSTFFGVLDVLMIPVLAFAFLILSAGWDYGKLNIHFTQYGRVAAQSGHFPEKEAAPTSAGVVEQQA